MSVLARLRPVLCVVAFCLLLVRPSWAGITTIGDVAPDPETTTGSDDLFVGNTTSGMMLVGTDSDVVSGQSYIGYSAGATGLAAVEGAGSTWSLGSLSVGEGGNGTLLITGGGQVEHQALGGGSPWRMSIGRAAGSTGHVIVAGQDSRLFGTSVDLGLFVGGRGNGTLAITGGGHVDNATASVGYWSGSTGTVTVDGVDSLWANSGLLYVGQGGVGTIGITGGGTVSCGTAFLGYAVGSTGTVTVNGDGSTWQAYCIEVGGHGAGVLAITGGGLVSGDDGGPFGYTLGVFVGGAAGSTGHVMVDGPGSTLAASDLTVGSEGAGTLSVTGAGLVTSGDATIGQREGSTGTVSVDGPGSAWLNNGRLRVGDRGAGMLSVTGGATVTSEYSDLGSRAGATGTAIVDGPGSSWTIDGDLTVGSRGTGIISVTGGGQVTSGIASLGESSGSMGTATISGAGSTWSATGLYVGGGGAWPGSEVAGTLAITGGGQVIVSGGPEGIGSFTVIGPVSDATVDGPGSTLSSQSIDVAGTLSVTGGGLATDEYGAIGWSPDSTGTVIVDGPGSTWTSSVELSVGRSGAGTLNITGGAVVDSGLRTYVGYGSEASGHVNLDGPDSTWNSGHLHIGYGGDGTVSVSGGGQINSGDLYVGYYDGAGTLNVSGGGTVTRGDAFLGYLSGSTGSATVNGAGSTWTNSGDLTIGEEGSGQLSVTGGGELRNIGNAYLGRSSGSSGTVTVDGAGSTWTNWSDLFVGGSQGTPEGGSGTLNITNGGLVRQSIAFLGYSFGSTGSVTVDGTGSTWANSSYLAVGYSGTGTLAVTNGAQVHSGWSDIGYGEGSTGVVTVDGAGSMWTTGGVSLGCDAGVVFVAGSGTLRITDGGRVTSNGDIYIGQSQRSMGAVTVDGAGSIWTVSRSVYVARGKLEITGGGTVDVGGDIVLGYWHPGTSDLVLVDGTLRMHGGTIVDYWGGGTFDFTGGRLEGARTINLGAPLVQKGGTLAPGNSIGTTTIAGGYTLDRGTLEICVNSYGPFWDLLDVNGPVDLVGSNGLLDGMLNVVLGFDPALGYEFLIVDNDGTDPIIGAFSTWSAVKAPFGDDLYRLAIDYTAGDGNDISLLTQSVGLLGDYNGNGAVDAIDYTLWQDTLGDTVAPYFGADGNGDGVVNEPDYDVWKAHFGGTAPELAAAKSASAAVPEPSGLALLVLGALAAVVARRR